MDTSLTLQEGLELFQRTNMKYFTKKTLSKEGADFLECHDIAHVVFGCNTSLYGEGVVKLWTTFGTTLSFGQIIKAYNDAEAFQLARKFSFGHVMKNLFRLFIAVPKTIIRAKKMVKPWPFYNYKAYLNEPLYKIRNEFNIRIIG